MHTREMRQEDLPRVITCSASANWDDSFIHWMNPHRFTNRMSYEMMCARRVTNRFYTPGDLGVVVVTDDTDPPDWPRDLVIGFGYYGRLGEKGDPIVKKWAQNNRGWWETLNRTLMRTKLWYFDTFHLDNSADYTNIALARKTDPDYYFAPLNAAGHWHAKVIMIDTPWQRKGAGSLLIQWLFDQARAEGLPASLVASSRGRFLYKKLGFKLVEWVTVPEETVLPGAIMIWEPIPGKVLREPTADEKTVEVFGVPMERDAVIDIKT